MAMNKKTVYTLFVLKFMLSLFLIFWTIYMTLDAGVGKDDDNSFISAYKIIDDDFNKIIEKNNDFNSKYNTIIKINDYIINSMNYNDVFLAQRNIKKRTKHKNILLLGKNSISIIIKNKNNNIIKNINADIVLTKPSTHNDDLKFNINLSNKNKFFNINSKAYWNIMGTIKIQNDEGYFFIKTNSK